MKKISCACGAEFKTHTTEELIEIVNVHAKRSHPKDFPQGMKREDVLKMMKDA